MVAGDYVRAWLARAKSRSVHADWRDFYHCTGHGKGKLSRIIKTEEGEENINTFKLSESERKN